jgi:class 3 adenylate cyclase/tetratricopeptide (TPR) repeat protein
MADKPAQIERIKQALQELRQNRGVFSTQAYGQIVMLLLNELRRANTLPPTPAATSDEVRLVTVIFIDVVGSTEMAETLDTSDWKLVIGEWHARIASLVTQWDGQIGQYLGDGLLCFFGAQRSRGDDALRAVSCALAAQTALNLYANEIQLRHNIEFSARIGLSTGRVVVGLIGSATRQELLALGPATNLAARLQSLAEPGGIVIDAATFSRIRNHFVTEQQEPVALKGFERPVKYYTVLRRSTHSTREFTSVSLSGLVMQFAGRDAEWQQIQTILDATLMQRRFSALTIVGDTGIGKSRLLQAVVERSHDMPFTALIMVSQYEQRNLPYYLLRDMLMNACELADDTPIDVARQQVTAYVTSVWDDPQAETVAAVMGYLAGFGNEEHPQVQQIKRGGQERARNVLTMVADWFKAVAESSGLLLIVDNLQWADTASVRLLEFLAHELHSTATAMIAAARPIYRSEHPLYMRGISQHTMMQLEPLSAQATATMIDSVLSQVERVPDTLKQLIIDRAEGNPLFVQEFLGMLFDNGVFYQHNTGKWRFNIIQFDTATASLPNGLIGVLQARLDDLSPEARQIIQIAAVIGQMFWSSAVAELTEINPHPVLETLVLRGMIVKQEDSVFENETQYMFRHTLYRDVAYEIIPRGRRETFHRDIARWFITRVSDKPEFYSTLAEQFEAGGQHDTALFTYLEAVQNRLNRALLTDALMLIDKGLALARNVPREVALPVVSQLWTVRGQALNALGRYEEASAASQSALMLYEEIPDNTLSHMRILAARMLAMAYTSLGRYDEAYQALTEAHEMLKPDDSLSEAAILRAFGGLCLYRGRLDESRVYLERALKHTENAGAEHINPSLTLLGMTVHDAGDMATALSHFERTLDNNYARNFRHYQAQDLRNIGLTYLTLMCYDRALATFDEAAAIQQMIGIEDNLLQAYRGLCYMLLGQRDEGFALLADAARRGDRDMYHARLLQLTYLRGLALIEDMVSCREQALSFVQQVRNRSPLLQARGLLWLGIAGHALGDPAASAVLQDALRQEKIHGGRDVWLCYEALARATDDDDKRRDYYAQAAETLRNIGKSLEKHPDLQYAFLKNDFVQGVIAAGV